MGGILCIVALACPLLVALLLPFRPSAQNLLLGGCGEACDDERERGERERGRDRAGGTGRETGRVRDRNRGYKETGAWSQQGERGIQREREREK